MRDQSIPLDVFRYCPRCGSEDGIAASIKQYICRNCGFVFFLNAAAAVIAIIEDSSGQALFTRRARNPGKGKLDFPGGFVDPGESAEEALRREVLEEVALTVESAQYIGSFANRYDYSGVTYHTTDLVFVCHVSHSDAAKSLLLQQEEVVSAEFRDPFEIPTAEMGLASAGHALQEYCRRRADSLRRDATSRLGPSRPGPS